MYVYSVITPFILSNCYFISVTVHETSKGRVTSPISHSWVKNDGSTIIKDGSLCRSGLVAPNT